MVQPHSVLDIPSAATGGGGAVLASATGVATTNVLVTVFTHVGANGLMGAGSIKNTGANDLVVRRTATDEYGTTDFQENTVLAGAELTWPMDTAIGTALPAFSSFSVAVKSAVAGSPTTFSLRHSTFGT